MSISFECQCGKTFRVNDDDAGRQVRCRLCGAILTVPVRPRTKLKEPDKRSDRTRRTPDQGDRATHQRHQQAVSPVMIVCSSAVITFCVGLSGWIFWRSTGHEEARHVTQSDLTENSEVRTDDVTGQPSPSRSETEVSSASRTEKVQSTPIREPAASTLTGPQTIPQMEPIGGDLELLQGNWSVTDIQMDSSIPAPPSILAEIDKIRIVVDRDIILVTREESTRGQPLPPFELKLDSTLPLKTIDLHRIPGYNTGSPEFVAILPGVYRLDGNQLMVCISAQGRPTEFNPYANRQQYLLKLLKDQPTPGSGPIPGRNQFDFAAWRTAYPQLQAMNISAFIDRVEIELPDGLTLLPVIDLPESADGQISPEVWAVISPLSHFVLRTGRTQSPKKTAITDQTLMQMSRHKGLLGLSVSGPHNLTPQGISHLQKCPNLRLLGFTTDAPASPQLIRPIAQLRELRMLFVSGSRLSRDEFSPILQLQKLESLELQDTGISDNEISMLAGLRQLTSLDLSNTQLTDKGLESLKSLSKLRGLVLSGTNVSQQAMADFQKVHSNCRVYKY